MLEDHLSRYKDAFTGYTELRAQINNFFSLSIDKDGSEQVTQGSKRGVSARVFENGAYGFAADSIYDDERVHLVLETARRNALAMGRRTKKPMSPAPDMPNGVIPINYPTRVLDLPVIKDAAQEMKRYAENRYSQAKVTVSMEQTGSEKLLVVQNGNDGRSNIVLGSIWVGLERQGSDGNPVTGSHSEAIDVYLNDFIGDPAALYSFVDKAYADLEKRLAWSRKDKAAPEGGIWDCILSPDFTGMLAHEAVGHTCEADAVLRKNSVAAKFMGKQVASELVSLTDFAYEAFGVHCPIPLHIDDEGTACKDAPIIADGILVGCMTNRDAAARLGVETTGNARASEYYDEPIIRMRNTCFLPGTSTLDQMIAAIDKGYYLTKSGGGNGSEKGEFNMIVSEGYEISKGKLGRPIRDTISAGIAWDALKTVDMVSSGFVNSKACGHCGKKQGIATSQGGPEMKLRLNIGGK